jgi:ParB family chromosome partitioning protein
MITSVDSPPLLPSPDVEAEKRQAVLKMLRDRAFAADASDLLSVAKALDIILRERALAAPDTDRNPAPADLLAQLIRIPESLAADALQGLCQSGKAERTRAGWYRWKGPLPDAVKTVADWEATEANQKHSAPNTPAPESTPVAVLIPINRIEPSPYQARGVFDDEKLQALAESIRQHGIIEPLVVRIVGQDERNPRYALLCGERRLRAAKLAGVTQVLAISLGRISDREAAEIGAVENLEREDLNPIETARAYQALSKLGLKQEQIATRTGSSQGRVSNTLRLLKLPDQVQAMVSDGSLSQGHAESISRTELAPWPRIQITLADLALSGRLTVRALAGGWETMPWYELTHGPGAPACDIDQDAVFDRQICETCPHGALLKIDQAHTYPRRYCLRPEHFEELSALARVENLRLATEAEARRRVAQSSNPGIPVSQLTPAQTAPIPHQSCTNPAPPADSSLSDLASHSSPLTPAEPAPLRLKEMSGLDYEIIRSTSPACCQAGECQCHRTALDHKDALVHVCIDAAHRLAVITAETKRRKVANKTSLESALDAWRQIRTGEIDPGLVARLAFNSVLLSPVAIRRQVASRLDAYPEARDLLVGSAMGSASRAEEQIHRWAIAATIPAGLLLDVAAEISARGEQSQINDNNRGIGTNEVLTWMQRCAESPGEQPQPAPQPATVPVNWTAALATEWERIKAAKDEAAADAMEGELLDAYRAISGKSPQPWRARKNEPTLTPAIDAMREASGLRGDPDPIVYCEDCAVTPVAEGSKWCKLCGIGRS